MRQVAKNLKEARDSGLSQYMGGKCKHGHKGRRWTSDRQCVDCKDMRRAERKEKQKAAKRIVWIPPAMLNNQDMVTYY